MQTFDAIRPYADHEIPHVIASLLKDDEFLQMIALLRLPKLPVFLSGLLKPWIRRWLARQFGSAQRVDDIQAALIPHVETLVLSTTAAVTQSGLDALSPDQSYLFMSNHRDIVFDPMLVNYLLVKQGLATTRIAIGDNLLENRVFAELMRVNKSFVVHRNLTSPREMRNSFLTLSAFIQHSIVQEGQNVWIAQREGRAKDGIDQTDPAIIKMLHMSQKGRGEGFADAMRALRIVPVAISYEYDPCDRDKAQELALRERNGRYEKAPGEDAAQIRKGLFGQKGRVHVHFANPILNPADDAKALAAQIDAAILAGYRLHPSNLAAAYLMPQAGIASGQADVSEQAQAQLQQRLQGLTAEQSAHLLAAYANPALRQWACPVT